ncbi:alpha/beta hydrolase [Staphylococcus xylosus]|nr:alpha/beta hydrolase [Staphylococcus xylosus]
MKNMFIIHGYQATTESHWFEWLTTEMKRFGYSTEIVYLPNTNHPVLDKWITAIQNSLENKLNSESIIVAHSLGVITILDYLSNLKHTPNIKGLFLISGFNEQLINLPELDCYISQTQIDYRKINAQHIVTIAGSHDPIVNIEATDRLSHELNTETLRVSHKGHFLDSDGYKTFEFLKNQITHSLNNKNSRIGS